MSPLPPLTSRYCSTCRQQRPVTAEVPMKCVFCGNPPGQKADPQPREEAVDRLTGDLFAMPREAPAQRHSATSLAAAEAIGPKLSDTRKGVLRFICEHVELHSPDGITDNALVSALSAKGWSPNSPRARRIELVRGGWLQENGVEGGSIRWRPTAKGWSWWLSEVHGEEGFASVFVDTPHPMSAA